MNGRIWSQAPVSRLVLILVLLFICGSAYGVDIVVIPITYYERQDTGYVQRNYERDITEDISAYLNTYHEVTIDKTPLRDRLAGVTDSDARRVADYYDIDDVLYGSIRADGNSLSGELKIYHRQREDYGTFYASDTGNQYERLIQTLCERILEWYHTDPDKVDVLQNELRNLRAELDSIREGSDTAEEDEETEKTFVLRFPFSLGYWSYVSQEWAGLVQGTAEVTLGLELCPELQFQTKSGLKSELSVGLNVGYRNGITSRTNEVMLHAVIVNPVIGYHINFYTKNWIGLTAGVFYESAFWDIKEKKYQNDLKYQQSLTGYTAALQYSYRATPLVALNVGANAYGYFTGDTSFIVRVYLGASITLIGRDYEL